VIKNKIIHFIVFIKIFFYSFYVNASQIEENNNSPAMDWSVMVPIADSEGNSYKLYKNFYYSTPKDTVRSTHAAIDCISGNDFLCVYEDFAGISGFIGLDFIDDRLGKVFHYSPYSIDNFYSITSAIQSEFVNIKITTGKEEFDLVRSYKRDNPDAREYLNKNKEEILKGNSVHLYIEKKAFNDLFKESSNAEDMIKRSKKDTRVVIYATDNLDGEIFSIISFFLPNIERNRTEQLGHPN
tara:strand:+ start:1277 stop:1996 length:720 start_codon:yes stop_codon:yes gene_type:complete